MNSNTCIPTLLKKLKEKKHFEAIIKEINKEITRCEDEVVKLLEFEEGQSTTYKDYAISLELVEYVKTPKGPDNIRKVNEFVTQAGDGDKITLSSAKLITLWKKYREDHIATGGGDDWVIPGLEPAANYYKVKVKEL